MTKLDQIQFIVIDLFCGAGGTTLGFELADNNNPLNKVAKVVACVNHDPIAIKSHWANHPEVEHFEEDITTLYGFVKRTEVGWTMNRGKVEVRNRGVLFQTARFVRLVRLVNMYRAFYPEAKVILWASLECTNFSKAKGGLPRDADSRTLADHLHPYITALNPDLIQIENVVEFMSWGPLDHKGKPVSKKAGRDWLKWREEICLHGYHDDWKQLNSADFGAYTSRNRLFGCFAKIGLPITWPSQTHHKKPDSVTVPVKKWQPVKHVLDFDDEGNSIFNRKKHLSTKTMQRLFMGCVKHIAGGKEHFMMKYYSGKPEHKNASIDNPAPTVSTFGCGALVKACFIDKAYSGKPEDKNSSIESPAPVITTKPHESIVFLSKYNSNNAKTGGNNGHSIDQPAPTIATRNNPTVVQADFLINYHHSSNSADLNNPAPTLTTHDKLGKVQACFISRYNGVNGGKHDNSVSVDNPIGALGTGDNHAKISAHFIQKYYTQGGQHNSIEEPAASLTTKDRLSKVSATFIDPLGAITTVPKSKLVQADFFIDKQFSGDENHQSIEQPAGSILTNDKHNLVQAEKFVMNTNFNNIGSSIEEPAPVLTASRRHHYIVNPSWGGNSGSVNEPCHVVIARQDKAPLYVITCQEGPVAVPVYEGDCEWTIKLKEFMALYNICDIKMRMLKVPELKKIQGFPETYVLLGNQTDQKKFIGNAVHPLVPMFWIQAFSKRLAA
jgi:DNA (cytosine-5)-methyltransferase 1